MNKLHTLLAATLALATIGTAPGARAADGTAAAPFLPPYILKSIAKHGNAAQRAQAQRQMLQDRAFVPGAMSQLEAQRRAALPPRAIYTANQTSALPGVLVWRGPQAPLPADKRVKEAAAGQAATIAYFKFATKKTLPVPGTVHYGFHYLNAFWDGTQMVFGDGDADLFKPFTCCIEIFGHERQHGLTGNRLTYRGQSGALDESLADVFGALTVQYLKGQSASQADWLIGKGLFTAKVKGRALRDMANPGTAYDDPLLGKDRQPAHMADYQNLPLSDDDGGVHVNSGIPNRAFVLFAKAVGGKAYVIPGKVWLAALNSSYPKNLNFAGFAQITVNRAQALYGAGVAGKLVKAWKQVGITTSGTKQVEIAAQ